MSTELPTSTEPRTPAGLSAGAEPVSVRARHSVDWTDRVLELTVGAIAHGGHCVARVPAEEGSGAVQAAGGGRVVFVRHALPGERVRAVVTDDPGAGFCRADTIAVLTASPDRVAAPCPWARAGGCGGCDLQHAAPEAQRRLKTAVLREQLARLGGLRGGFADTVEVEALPGGALGWRRRIRLAVDDEGRAGLRAHRSHEVLPIADCLLAPPGMLDGVLGGRFAPGSEIEVVLDSDDRRHVIGEEAAGPIVERAAGRQWRLSPGSFWQVHPALAGMLAELVGEWVAAPAGGVAWDLYGGVGLFAAVLAGQVGPKGSVAVVDSAVQAVADGRRSFADLPWVEWHADRVERRITALADPDVVVADPPRKGLGGALVEALCARGPARLVYIACDPAALSRDVAHFASHGYTLAGLRSFDAFPMTHHMESVALLTPTP